MQNFGLRFAGKVIYSLWRAFSSIREVWMRVRVERIRPGRRKPEIDYLEARAPRRREHPRETPSSGMASDPWGDHDLAASGLRLPWQTGRGQKRGA